MTDQQSVKIFLKRNILQRELNHSNMRRNISVLNPTFYVKERGLLAEGAQFMMMSIDYNIQEVKFSFSDFVHQEVIFYASDFYFCYFFPIILVPSNAL